MEFYDWSVIIGMVAIIGFLWKLSQDMRKLEFGLTKEIRDLGERVAKIEGALFHGIGFKQDEPVGNLHD